MRDVADDAEVMGDEEKRDAEVALQVLEQVDHLRPDRDVERRDRLVGDDEVGLQRERAGDADALALAAGEGVRVAVLGVARQADDAEELADLVARLVGLPDQAVDDQRLGDDVEDLHPRIEAGVGVLEDDLHVAAELSELLAADRGDVLALEEDLARGDADAPEDGASGGRLA